MCDTIVSLAEGPAAGPTLFGKNSDRERNEAQIVELCPAAVHERDSTLRCSYITIPQVCATHQVLLCRPFWMWGAEMGANEHGVVIGNEAVFGRFSPPRDEALLGMDLLRLGLERGATAVEALEVIISLLETYGQGGNCGLGTPSFYHNSFIIADAGRAFILETVARDWLVEDVRGARSISNSFSIGRGAQRISPGFRALLRDGGGCPNIALDYANMIEGSEFNQSGHTRRARSTNLLHEYSDALTAQKVMTILRDHGSEVGVSWYPKLPSHSMICAHATDQAPYGQTVGSMVSELAKDRIVHWVTATAVPCLSIFKPVLIGAPLPNHGPKPTDKMNSNAHWWRHRVLQDALVRQPNGVLTSFRAERDAAEADFHTRIAAVLQQGDERQQAQVVADCWSGAIELENRWLARLNRATSMA